MSLSYQSFNFKRLGLTFIKWHLVSVINLIKRKLRPQSVTDLKQNCVSFPPGKIVEIYAFRNWELDRKAGFEEQTSFNHGIYQIHNYKEKLLSEPNLNESFIYLGFVVK